MPFLSSRDGSAVRDVAAALESGGERAAVSFAGALEMTRELVRSQSGVKFAFGRRGNGLALDGAVLTGDLPGNAPAEFDSWLADKLVGWTFYNPLCPEPAQRNVAVAFDAKTLWRNPPAVARDLFPGWGLKGSGCARMILCEGPAMAGYVSFYRREPYTPRELRVLKTLARPTRERLRLDELLNRAPLTEGALAVALDAISSAAFVLGPHAVAQCNRLGKSRLESDPQILSELRSAVRGESSRYLVMPIRAPGFPTHHLLVEQVPAQDPAPRAALAAVRFDLTPRQRQVLTILAQGRTNKEIAAQLGCAVATVDLHVKALLRKLDARSRSEIAARLWTLG